MKKSDRQTTSGLRARKASRLNKARKDKNSKQVKA
ncbi:hypothetical protein COLO4_33479 [Corchorus olitorius]|uniref:Uncharacterized protein n=1 Tax=Corchorus olitorius TaxID=93759 RepID=A0A1R3GTC2_9ROSI|nr:hypothetical protein COLO4_33479 [Corchorus olitorius]